MVCLMPFDGMGKHWWTLSDANRKSYFKHIWATNTTYCASATFIKLAILFQYLRLYGGDHCTARIVTWTTIIVSSVWGIIFFFLALFACTPVQKNWNISMNGKCFGWGTKDPEQFFPMWAAHAASNMFLDLVVFVIPMVFLRQLAISTKSRKGLITLFCLGGVVVAISIARMIVLSGNRLGTVPKFDVTFYTPVVYLTSVLEVSIAILCASIPIFWPLVAKLSMDRILVVKEVEVRSHRRESDGFALHENDSSKVTAGLGFTNPDFNLTTQEIEAKAAGGVGGRASRLSVTHIHPSIGKLQKDPLRSHSPAFGCIGLRRSSHESTRKLNLERHESSTSSVTGSPDSRQTGNSAGWNDQWSFDPERDGENARRKRGNTTTVARAVSPYDYIKSAEN